MGTKIEQKKRKIRRLLIFNLVIWILFFTGAFGGSMLIDIGRKCFAEYYQTRFTTIQKAVARIAGIGGAPTLDAKDKIEAGEIKESEATAVISTKPRKQRTTLASRQALPKAAKGPQKRTRVPRSRISRDRDDIVSTPRGGDDVFADPYPRFEHEEPGFPFGGEDEVIIEEERPAEESPQEEKQTGEEGPPSDDDEDTLPSSSSPGYYYSGGGGIPEPGEGGEDEPSAEPPSDVDFKADITRGDGPLTVTFTYSATGDIDTLEWDFGDGGTSTEENPTYTFETPGRYSVTLILSGPAGTASFTRSGYIYVSYPLPETAFTFDPPEGRAPLAVTFTDQSTQYGGDIILWQWHFGDQETSVEQNPSHTYAVPGTYTITLIVTGNGGTGTPTTKEITISHPLPVADFIPWNMDYYPDVGPLESLPDFEVGFQNKSIQEYGTIYSCEWDFGDGGTSTEYQPIHTYTTSGKYTVTLIVTGSGGTDTITKTDLINVLYHPPVADFEADVAGAEGEAPLTVTFTDQSTGEIESWDWNFGDGGTSTEQNPTHIYEYVGDYTARLIAKGPGGEDDTEMDISVTFSGEVLDAYADKEAVMPGGTFNLHGKITDGKFESFSWLCDGQEFISGTLEEGQTEIDATVDTSKDEYAPYFTPGNHTIELLATNNSVNADRSSEPFILGIFRDGQEIQDAIDAAPVITDPAEEPPLHIEAFWVRSRK
jgi:PKD repeat protein